MIIKRPRMKEEMEQSYETILASYATARPKENSRDYNESGDDYDNRSSFQRDRDRIIHTNAFRRLMYKTQVFVNHEGDYFRTRLTHTLEVAQFARGICKSLALNEELAEAIALGHDLGHTPFGHAVEKYFDNIMQQEKAGRFFHNEQSVRVVDYLEIRDHDKKGLNLTAEVREGILKHNKDRSGIYENLYPDKPCSTLEGQVVTLVDTIAYICHDLEDAIKSGIIEEVISRNPDMHTGFKEMAEQVAERTGVTIEFSRYKEPLFIRKLIHYFIQELTEDSWENIQKHNVENLSDVQKCVDNNIVLVSFSRKNADFFRKFAKMIYSNVYETRTIKLMDKKAVEVVRKLFEMYKEEPKLLPPEWYYAYNHVDNSEKYPGAQHSKTRVIIDYISIMTDRYALDESEQVFNPSVKI